jgi:hypothetical protein
MTSRTSITLILGSLTLGLNAQYGDGLNGSAFNGLWALDRQPAAIGLSPNKLEVNLFHLTADVDNSYLALERERLGFMGFGNMIRPQTGEGHLGMSGLQQRSIDIHARVQGPAVMYRIGNRTTVALSTGLRHATRATGIDALTDLFGGRVLGYTNGEVRPMDELAAEVNTLSWGEAGIHLAQHFPISERVDLHVGVAGKYLAGIAGGYIRNEAPTLDATDPDNILLHDVDLQYGISDFGGLGTMGSMTDLVQGMGIGMDAGAVLTWKPAMRHDEDGQVVAAKRDYIARLSLSVTDMGGIRFAGNTVQRHIQNGRVCLADAEGMSAPAFAEIDATIAELVQGEHQAAGSAGMHMALPTAMHANLDLQATGKVFINMAATMGIDRGLQAAHIPHNLSITPRFGGRRVEVGLPVSLHQFDRLKVGMALRVGGFMVGSDKLGGLFGLTNLSGMDLYMGVKVNLVAR